MSEWLIRASALGKAFPRVADSGVSMLEFARLLAGKPVPSTPVLRDISFEIRPGESLGIIGENGAGKSTLLKLLTGILKPSSGVVERRCRVGALLELGAGFDKALTGRQNIALSAGLLGWSRAEIQSREESIIAFADIGGYIDEPVRHYSSGMVVRLGFAIVAAVRPDLLITDEVLAVGDESFQKKCIRWIEDYLTKGGTLLFVSHSMYHIQKLCKHALWLRQGSVVAYGDVFDVTREYLAYHECRSAEQADRDNCITAAPAELRILEFRLNGKAGEVPTVIEEGEVLHLEVELEAPEESPTRLGLGLVRADGTAIFGTTSEIDQAAPVWHRDGRALYRLSIELALLPGAYGIRLHSIDPEGIRVFDTKDRGFVVRGRRREVGMVDLKRRWG